MHHHYKDILDRADGAPLWWDEHAVPRFCEFGPDEVANIYADEVVLLRIHCQACGYAFRVAMSAEWSRRWLWARERLDHPDTDAQARLTQESSLGSLIVSGRIHYGDPPNYCCHAGATMNSVPILAAEVWTRRSMDWVRIRELEREIDCEWKDK